MRVIAAGRASEILDLGGGRVLRRFKRGGDPESGKPRSLAGFPVGGEGGEKLG